MTPEKFVETFLPHAIKTEKETGISAVAILAQAALESGWGEKAIGNMMFGVKAKKDTPDHQKQLIVTTEYSKRKDLKFPEILSITPVSGGRYKYKIKDWFRKYESPEESFTDHARFLKENPRYGEAMKVCHLPLEFIKKIAEAGYATDPSYCELLTAVAQSITKRLPKKEDSDASSSNSV